MAPTCAYVSGTVIVDTNVSGTVIAGANLSGTLADGANQNEFKQGATCGRRLLCAPPLPSSHATAAATWLMPATPFYACAACAACLL